MTAVVLNGETLPDSVGDPYSTSRLQPGIPADYALLVVQNNNSAVESVEYRLKQHIKLWHCATSPIHQRFAG